jgi:hypothetical protein
MRSERIAAALLAVTGVALGAGCSQPESYIVLSLKSAMPIDNVADIEVKVSTAVPASDGGADAGIPAMARTLTYDAHGASINQNDEKTLSVGFSHGETGSILFVVDARNNLGCSIGHGMVTQEIKKGGVVQATVSLVPGLNCTGVDGGAPEVPEGSPLPGCDPVNPQNPAATSADGGADGAVDGGVLVCTATQTCQVDCVPPNNAPPRNECVPGGTGAPGATCTTNADCMPGTQCFNYAGTGCNVKVCLRFCNGNADCAAFGAGGGGPGSFCEGPVQCPTFLTAYHTCTFNCDPRAMAAGTGGGCPTGLVCLMPAAMDQVDCACREPTRTKVEGQACTQAADCAPGLICNQMSGTKTCRPICRCNANASGTCTATTSDCPTAGTTCHAVTNNTTYGICL